MGKVDLGYNKDEEQPQQEAPQAAPAEDKSNLPAPYQPVLGDYIPSMADMRLPRINIVHGVGQLKENFPVGALVYNSQITVHEAKLGQKEASLPVELVVLGWLPIRYAEKVPGGGRGMLVSSLEAVRDAGGTLDYKEWKEKRDAGMRRFETLAEAVCLIKQPAICANDDAQFPFVIPAATKEGEEPKTERWALGVWGMKGTAFTNGAKTIFTARQMGCCLEGYPSCSWFASTESKPFKTEKGDTSIPVPKFVPGKVTSAAFRKFAINIVNGTKESGPAEE
jgi:hypothetical protein